MVARPFAFPIIDKFMVFRYSIILVIVILLCDIMSHGGNSPCHFDNTLCWVETFILVEWLSSSAGTTLDGAL